MIVPISFFYVVRMDTTAAAAAAARTYFVVEHPIFHTDALCAVSSSCCRRSGRGSFDRGGKSGPSVAIASHLWRVIRGSRVCVWSRDQSVGHAASRRHGLRWSWSTTPPESSPWIPTIIRSNLCHPLWQFWLYFIYDTNLMSGRWFHGRAFKINSINTFCGVAVVVFVVPVFRIDDTRSNMLLLHLCSMNAFRTPPPFAVSNCDIASTFLSWIKKIQSFMRSSFRL